MTKEENMKIACFWDFANQLHQRKPVW